MTYVGKISKGTIILPPNVHLREGTIVEIKPIHSDAEEFTDALEQIAARGKGLPPDVPSVTEVKNVDKVAEDRAAVLKKLRGAGRKYLKPGQDPIAELIAERKWED